MSKFFLILIFIYISTIRGYTQEYDTIRVGFYSSVNLIFDSSIEKWDMGLGVKIEGTQEIWDVLVEGASSNRIKLAAGVTDFKTTNLFVETSAAYYNFILKYDPNPKNLLIKVNPDKASIVKEIKQEPTAIEDQVADNATNDLFMNSSRIYNLQGDYLNIGQELDDMIFYLGGIFLSGDYLYFKVYIKNNGTIPYDLGFMGFFIGDKGLGGNKRRPVQLENIKPIFIYNEALQRIEGGELASQVYVFGKFTLAKKRKLYIQFWEGNGGERKAELEVKGREILGAEEL